MSARFLFVIAQPGSERPLKNEVAREHPELRFAFSRPGFVTFRSPDEMRRDFALRSVFARTWGYSLGKVGDATDAQLASDAWRLVGEQPPDGPIRHVHVWTRDRALPGDEGYDGAADELARAVGALLLEQEPDRAELSKVNSVAAAGDVVLDCVLVERDEWWLGWHRAEAPETRWPGGVPT